MTELRQSMIEWLQLRGLAERPQDMYVRAVRQRAEHSHTSPDCITEEELRQSFLSIKNVTQSSRSASPLARGGLTFFFAHPLHRDWTTLRFVRAPREKTLPVLLSCGEGPQAARGCQTPGGPRVPLHHLLRRSAAAGRNASDGRSHRPRSDEDPWAAGERRDRSLGPLATTHPGTAARVLGHPSASRLALPCTGAWAYGVADRNSTEAHAQSPGRLEGSPHRAWPPHTSLCAHAAPGLGDPLA
jgi:hypothetical protein